MPVNSKKQGQVQTGKKGDDAKVKANKAAGANAGSSTAAGGTKASSKKVK